MRAALRRPDCGSGSGWGGAGAGGAGRPGCLPSRRALPGDFPPEKVSPGEGHRGCGERGGRGAGSRGRWEWRERGPDGGRGGAPAGDSARREAPREEPGKGVRMGTWAGPWTELAAPELEEPRVRAGEAGGRASPRGVRGVWDGGDPGVRGQEERSQEGVPDGEGPARRRRRGVPGERLKLGSPGQRVREGNGVGGSRWGPRGEVRCRGEPQQSGCERGGGSGWQRVGEGVPERRGLGTVGGR